MALVMPLLALMLLGMIDFGRMLNVQITVTEAARESARAVALGYTGEEMKTATGVLRGDSTTTVDSPCDGAIDPPTGDPDSQADDAVVTVSYEFQTLTGVESIMGIFGDEWDGHLTITAQGVMPCLGSG